MKKEVLIGIISFMSFYGLSQNVYIGNDSLEDMYLEYCYADSVVVGYRYILGEKFHEDGSGWQSIIDVYKDFDHPKFNPRNKYTYEAPEDYIRVEDIKEPHEYPSFEGFVKWKRKIK